MQSKVEQVYPLRFRGVKKMVSRGADKDAYENLFNSLGGAIVGTYEVDELVDLMQVFKALGKVSAVVLDSIDGTNPVPESEAESWLYSALLQFMALLCEDAGRLSDILQAYSADIMNLAELGRKISKKGDPWTRRCIK